MMTAKGESQFAFRVRLCKLSHSSKYKNKILFNPILCENEWDECDKFSGENAGKTEAANERKDQQTMSGNKICFFFENFTRKMSLKAKECVDLEFNEKKSVNEISIKMVEVFSNVLSALRRL